MDSWAKVDHSYQKFLSLLLDYHVFEFDICMNNSCIVNGSDPFNNLSEYLKNRSFLVNWVKFFKSTISFQNKFSNILALDSVK